jgi:glycosyltransferase involved in cell wall biosynthesis
VPGVREAEGRHLLMTADAVGGVWSYALDLARGLASHGTRVTLAVLGPAPDAAQRAAAEAIPNVALEVTGLPLDWLASTPAEVLAAGRAVAAIAERIGADLVQLNSPALAAAPFPVPVVGVCHSCVATWWRAVRGGDLPEDFRWRTAILAEGYAAADALVAPSRAFARATQAAYGLAAQVVHNGRRDGPRTPRMGAFAFTAGRLWDEGKDLATLDRAAARLDIPVLAAGPTAGPNGTAVALPRLKRLGTLDEAAMRSWLARGPVFVSAARYEPFGLAVLEAAQAGCALVLSDIPTFRELWKGAALFVAPGDDDGFATAIRTLVADREQRARLRVAAGERARRYSLEAMASGMHAIHAGLHRRLGQGGGREAA